MDNKYSVLMSGYYNENAEYLRQSMMTVFLQTVKTNDFVLVCDGPLGGYSSTPLRRNKE